MLHNLPFALADFGVLPHEHELIKVGINYWKNKGKEIFEQDEDSPN